MISKQTIKLKLHRKIKSAGALMSIQSVQVLNTKQCMYKNIIRSTNHLDLLSPQKLNKTFSFFLAQ